MNSLSLLKFIPKDFSTGPMNLKLFLVIKMKIALEALHITLIRLELLL